MEKPISMRPVKSSNIKAIGYDDGTLRVEFKNGGRYDYDGVKPEEYDALVDADADKDGSVGRTFHGTIRAKYKGKKL